MPTWAHSPARPAAGAPPGSRSWGIPPQPWGAPPDCRGTMGTYLSARRQTGRHATAPLSGRPAHGSALDRVPDPWDPAPASRRGARRPARTRQHARGTRPGRRSRLRAACGRPGSPHHAPFSCCRGDPIRSPPAHLPFGLRSFHHDPRVRIPLRRDDDANLDAAAAEGWGNPIRRAGAPGRGDTPSLVGMQRGARTPSRAAGAASCPPR